MRKEFDEHKTLQAKKEAEAERLKEEGARMDRANQNFYQQSTKFTELFEKVAGLNQRKQMQEQNLAALKKHIKLLKGETALSPA